MHFVAGRVSTVDGPEIVCVCLRLTPPPPRFDFWTAGCWQSHRSLRDTHRHELQEVLDQLETFDASVALMVGGDFNTVPLDRSLEILGPNFRDAFAERGRGWGATGTNDWPLFRVDQV